MAHAQGDMGRGGSAMRVPLEVSVPVSALEEGEGGKYTSYEVVTVTAEGRTWSVKHRYSEFATLYARLNASLPLPVPLPPKKMWGNFNADFVEGRRQGLEAFIKVAVKQHMQIQALAPAVSSFIGADAHMHAEAEAAAAEAAAAERYGHDGPEAEAVPAMTESEWSQGLIERMRDDLIDVSELPMALEGPDADERLDLYRDVSCMSIVVEDSTTFAIPPAGRLDTAALLAALLEASTAVSVAGDDKNGKMMAEACARVEAGLAAVRVADVGAVIVRL